MGSNGNVIAGTPLTWHNGSALTLTWGKGTQLATSKKRSTTTTYTYDMSGVRSAKTIGTTSYDFKTLRGLVVRQTWGLSRLDFIYDENNRPFAMLYKANTATSSAPAVYYYLLDLQGDVIGLMDTNGNVAAYYDYDPWGATKVLNPNGSSNSSSSFIGNINPLRYRGYYYDTETGFYYLESRYYDPTIGRFISADEFVTTDSSSILSANMFAYCENEPISRSDPNGKFVNTLLGAAAGGFVAMVTRESGESAGAAFTRGAVTGAQV